MGSVELVSTEDARWIQQLQVLGRSLSDQQKRFCEAYVGEARFHARIAERIALGQRKGRVNNYSSRWMRIPKVRAYIAALVKWESREFHFSRVRIMQEAAAIGFSDISDFLKVEADGSITLKAALDDLPKEVRVAIKEIIATETTSGSGDTFAVTRKITVRLHDKLEALKLLGVLAPNEDGDAPIDNNMLGGLMIIAPGAAPPV